MDRTLDEMKYGSGYDRIMSRIYKVLPLRGLSSSPSKGALSRDKWCIRFNKKTIEYIAKIFLNDDEYVKNNYEIIMNNESKQTQLYCFMVGCMFSKKVKIIEFLKNKFNINILQAAKGPGLFSGNCSDDPMITYVCKNNGSYEVIKYLMKIYGIEQSNPMYGFSSTDQIFDKCMDNACQYNTNINVIRYFLHKSDAAVHGNRKFNMILTNEQMCLTVPDIKYLMDNINLSLRLYPSLYLENASKNPMMTKEVIKFMELQLSSDLIKRQVYWKYNLEEIIQFVAKRDYQELNDVIGNIYRTYALKCIDEKKQVDYKELNSMVQSLNPLLLSKKNIEISESKDPYSEKFKDYVKLVDCMKIKVPIIQENISPDNYLLNVNSNIKQQLLFFHNNMPYRGDKKVVYRSMLFIDGAVDYKDDTDEVFILNAPAPRYIINLYINASCATKRFDINQIEPSDLKQFLNLIDQYPTDVLSIDKIDKQLVGFIELHNIPVDDWLKNFIERYGLKYMYLYIHNKKIE